MKNLILVSLFFSTNVFSMWMSADDVANCGNDGYKYTSYIRKQSCDKNHIDCINIFNGHNCKTDSNLDIQVDDKKRPKFSKSNPVTCVDDNDCQTKLAAKVCVDTLETAIKNLLSNPKEVYCSKQIGFFQKTIKMVREDPVRKAAWDADPSNPVNIRALRRTRRQQLVALIPDVGDADLTQLRAIVKKMMRDKYSNN